MKHSIHKWTSCHLSTEDGNLLFVGVNVILTAFVDKASKEHPNIYTNKNVTHTTITDVHNGHKGKSAFEICSHSSM